MNRKLPAFLDTDKMIKHYVDLETGEIVHSTQATEEDKQSNLFN